LSGNGNECKPLPGTVITVTIAPGTARPGRPGASPAQAYPRLAAAAATASAATVVAAAADAPHGFERACRLLTLSWLLLRHSLRESE
jgi:hypothetical protein